MARGTRRRYLELAFVAGILLPFLNAYFVLRDLISRRWKDAAIGVILSIVAVMIAVNPAWGK